MLSLLMALLQAAPPHYLPTTPDRGVHECIVAGVFVHEGALTIRCETPAPDGVVLFAVEREQLRYEDFRDFATWAQEHRRPLGLLYVKPADKNPRGCDPAVCRHLLGVERR